MENIKSSEKTSRIVVLQEPCAEEGKPLIYSLNGQIKEVPASEVKKALIEVLKK